MNAMAPQIPASRLFTQPFIQGENEDVVGAAPTGDTPTTSKWSTILLPNKVQLDSKYLEVFHICGHGGKASFL